MKPRNTAHEGPFTLAIDIGGTGIKMLVLDGAGRRVNERERVPTPKPASPRAVLAAIARLVKTQPEFERVSVGFPGVVRRGVVETAHNLGTRAWVGFNIETAVRRLTKKPVRAANDACVQGLGAVRGQGLELLLTLGTGVGSALFLDGRRAPNLELGHHPFRHDRTYEEALCNAERERIGNKKWRHRLARAIATLQPIFNWDRLYLGGGNTEHVRRQDVPAGVHIGTNLAGLTGGVRLWDDAPAPKRPRNRRAVKAAPPPASPTPPAPAARAGAPAPLSSPASAAGLPWAVKPSSPSSTR